jgi:hypothetical protein
MMGRERGQPARGGRGWTSIMIGRLPAGDRPVVFIWNPQKLFFWYIPGIFQVYTFPVDMPGIYP